MTDAEPFALLVLLAAGVGLVAVLSNRLTERVKIPSPALVLVGAAIAVQFIPALHAPPWQAVERGRHGRPGLHLVRRRHAHRVLPVPVRRRPHQHRGVLGTFLTMAATAALLHLVFNLAWYVALLVATAVAPTDPAVVFSVLGQREISGRSGTILEGESGANDPVGMCWAAPPRRRHS